MRNLIDGEFAGTVLPVNTKFQTIHRQVGFESVSALETAVNLAIIATLMRCVVDIVGECVKKIGGLRIAGPN